MVDAAIPIVLLQGFLLTVIDGCNGGDANVDGIALVLVDGSKTVVAMESMTLQMRRFAWTITLGSLGTLL